MASHRGRREPASGGGARCTSLLFTSSPCQRFPLPALQLPLDWPLHRDSVHTDVAVLTILVIVVVAISTVIIGSMVALITHHHLSHHPRSPRALPAS